MDNDLVPHLEELRSRLIKSCLCLFVGMVISYYFSTYIIDFLKRPLLPHLPSGAGLVYTGITDKFMLAIKASFLGAIVLSVPYILFQIWGFIRPALREQEKKMVVPFVVTGISLFLTGFLFSYYLVLPQAYAFLIEFGGDIASPMITIREYFNFTIFMLLCCSLTFELPLILYSLSKTGLIDVELLTKYRRQAIIILAVLAAVITPTQDPVNMAILFLPLYVLYEITIMLLRAKKRN